MFLLSVKEILHELLPFSTQPVTFRIRSKSEEVFLPPLAKIGTFYALKWFLENFLRFVMQFKRVPSASSKPMLSSIGWYLVSSGLPEKNLNSLSIPPKGFLQLSFPSLTSKT